MQILLVIDRAPTGRLVGHVARVGAPGSSASFDGTLELLATLEDLLAPAGDHPDQSGDPDRRLSPRGARP